MPYIGNTAGNRFVASKAATQFSGDGSTTAFTLDHAVGSDEDILVSVDGVIQEPSVAYAVSNGTTLTFTGAPSSNSGNNIFVYYLFRTVATVDHPSTSSLQATDGTFTGAFTSKGIDDNADATAITIDSSERVMIGTTTQGNASADDLTVAGSGNTGITVRAGTSNSSSLYFSDATSGAAEYSGFLDYAHGTDKLSIGVNQSTKLSIDSNGNVVKDSNPSFRAMGTNAAYQTTSPVPFSSVSTSGTGAHNIGSHYNTSNYRFTAPVAGRYLFHLHMGIIRITANDGNGYPYIRINGTPVSYSYVRLYQSSNYVYAPAHVTQIFNLAASDYVDVTFVGNNADYYGNYTELSFQGYLLG